MARQGETHLNRRSDRRQQEIRQKIAVIDQQIDGQEDDCQSQPLPVDALKEISGGNGQHKHEMRCHDEDLIQSETQYQMDEHIDTEARQTEPEETTL